VQLEGDNEAKVEVYMGLSEGHAQDDIHFEEDPQAQVEVV